MSTTSAAMADNAISKGLSTSLAGIGPLSTPEIVKGALKRYEKQYKDLLEAEEEVPDNDLAKFTRCKEALDEGIKDEFPKASQGFKEEQTAYNIYIRMRARWGGTKKARLVIVYKNAGFREELERILHHSKGWRSLLKKNDYKEPLFELGDPSKATRAKFAISELGGNLGSILGAELLLRYHPRTSADEYSPSSYPRSTTIALGGIVLVDDKLFGLTVGHHDILLGSPDMSEEVISEQDLFFYEVRDREDEAIEGPSLDDQSSGSEGLIGEVHAFQFGAESRLNRDEVNEAADWALVELVTALPLANILTFDVPATDEGLPALKGTVLVKNIMTEAEFSAHEDVKEFGSVRCFIVTKKGILPALVACGTSILVLSGKSFEVLNIDTGEDLPAGSSGSWVVVGDQLLGTVIAKQSKPWRAFAIPIEQTFQSIQHKLGAKRIALPTAVDNRILGLEKLEYESRWRGATRNNAFLEWELLLARRRAERRPHNFRYFAVDPDGAGWAGVSKDDVLRSSPSLTDLHINMTEGFSLSARLYESFTGLQLSTIRSLLLLGHVFPISPSFRISMRLWLSKHKSSSLRGRRAAAIRGIADNCLNTEAGENIVSLFLTLRTALQDEDREYQAVWFSTLFKSLFGGLGFPATLVPSAQQLQTFARCCLAGLRDSSLQDLDLAGEGATRMRRSWRSRHLIQGISRSESQIHSELIPSDLISKEVGGVMERPDRFDFRERRLPKSENIRDGRLLEVAFVSRLLLRLGDVTRGGHDKVLVCAGTPYAELAGSIAVTALGNVVAHRRRTQDDTFRDIPSRTPEQVPEVYAFTNTNVYVCELMSRDELAKFRP